jgi:hypothetical protein
VEGPFIEIKQSRFIDRTLSLFRGQERERFHDGYALSTFHVLAVSW